MTDRKARQVSSCSVGVALSFLYMWTLRSIILHHQHPKSMQAVRAIAGDGTHNVAGINSRHGTCEACSSPAYVCVCAHMRVRQVISMHAIWSTFHLAISQMTLDMHMAHVVRLLEAGKSVALV